MPGSRKGEFGRDKALLGGRVRFRWWQKVAREQMLGRSIFQQSTSLKKWPRRRSMAGADPDCQNRTRKTPLLCAAARGREEVGSEALSGAWWPRPGLQVQPSTDITTIGCRERTRGSGMGTPGAQRRDTKPKGPAWRDAAVLCNTGRTRGRGASSVRVVTLTTLGLGRACLRVCGHRVRPILDSSGTPGRPVYVVGARPTSERSLLALILHTILYATIGAFRRVPCLNQRFSHLASSGTRLESHGCSSTSIAPIIQWEWDSDAIITRGRRCGTRFEGCELRDAIAPCEGR